MQKSICTILFLLFLAGCQGSTIYTGAEAEENVYNLSAIRKGMNEKEVYEIMGDPYKIETKTIDNVVYDIWFYITKGTYMSQTRMIPQNFTPLIFQGGILQGWGYAYYNHLLDIDNEQGKREEDRRQKYTEDRDEWPSDEHRMVPGRLPHEMDKEPQTSGPSMDMIEKEEEKTPSKESDSPCNNRQQKSDRNWW